MAPVRTFVAAIATTLSLAVIADSAWARRGGGGHGGGHHRGHHHHHGHFHHGFGFWGGFWGPYWGAGYWPGSWGGYWGPGWGYWGAPVVAYTRAVIQEPHVWVERDVATATPPPRAPANQNPNAQQWWYWCVSAKKYYPYVASCAEGWQRVAPQATPAQ